MIVIDFSENKFTVTFCFLRLHLGLLANEIWKDI